MGFSTLSIHVPAGRWCIQQLTVDARVVFCYTLSRNFSFAGIGLETVVRYWAAIIFDSCKFLIYPGWLARRAHLQHSRALVDEIKMRLTTGLALSNPGQIIWAPEWP
jgi:hypothetical protein